VSTWAPAKQCETCSVLDLVTDGSRAYQAVGGAGGRVVALSLTSGSRSWSRSGDGDVQAVALHNGVVHAGGHFTSFDGSVKHQLVALSASSGAVQPFTVAFTGSDAPGIWSVSANAGALRIAGGFRLAASPAARYAAFPTA
jgi:outer membrane protein assembly factor BamB